jgi:glucuronate isomerase
MSTIKPFMDDNFLLENDVAIELYHSHAKKMPIIDYHCHLSPKMIAEDYHFRSITELWLSGDHYKWRAMRANGIDEKYITGDASDWDKFQAWAATVPYTMRNPLYHWTHLELKTAFGINEVLNPQSAKRIYDACNERLMSAREYMKHYNVEVVCTTDDPIDSLEYHKQIAKSDFGVKVLPSWRPDKAIIGSPEYLERLGEAAGIEIHNKNTLIQALKIRHDYFESVGCKVADHGLTDFPSPQDSELLLELCKMNHSSNWVQQFHYGALRNTNSKMYQKIGADTGFDSINDNSNAGNIAIFLDSLNKENKLAKTILYNLNPSDNVWLAAMIGNFQDGTIPGKIQLGSGWWFNDQLKGMREQIDALSCQGLLSRFVGMLTDSRSFVSYPRHEYFRRLLCNIIGNDIEHGLIPISELSRVENMIEDISYNNAKNYFNF